MVGGDRAHKSMTQRNVLLNGRNQWLEQTLNMLKTAQEKKSDFNFL